MWQPGLLCRTFHDLNSFASCLMHVNAFNLDPELNSPKQWVNRFTYTTWGFPLPSWNLINDSIEFYRGFARGATSSLPWTPVPQLFSLRSTEHYRTRLLQGMQPFKLVKVRSLTNTCYNITSGLNNVIINRH